MTDHEHDDSRPDAAGHETRDVNVGAVAKILLGLAGVIIATYAITVGLFHLFASREADGTSAPAATAQPAGTDEQLRWPEPRIQSSPATDMAKLRAEQDAVLTSYGWVDRNAGVVRIPIDVAMKLVLEEGLPVRQPAGAPPATGTPDPAGPPAAGGSRKMEK